MYRAHNLHKDHYEVIILFKRMTAMGVPANCFTFPVLLKSCVDSKLFLEGLELHCSILKTGFLLNSYVGASLMDLYIRMRNVSNAYKVFVEMIQRNVVIWTSMISGYITCGEMHNAESLFDLAPERDIIMWNILLSGHIENNNIAKARDIFDRMPNKDLMAWNTMLGGCSKIGKLEDLERLFNEVPQRNAFTFNALLSGYLRDSKYSHVLRLFSNMVSDNVVIPDDMTLVTVLSACARSGALDLGKWIHSYSDECGYKDNIFVCNALMDMYSKCGRIDRAVEIFRDMKFRDLITWNTVIGGLAVNGGGNEALSLFLEMKKAKLKPDGITFVGILSACSHMGLVEEGFFHFNSMANDYSIEPKIEHYGCMVDLLGRAGLLSQAMDFVEKMPIDADGVIWGSLLGACRVHRNVELGETALRKLMELEPGNPANYAMLSNLYGDLGEWKDVARLKIAMRDTGLKKETGFSFIEVNDKVVRFCSLDAKHPKAELIYRVLKSLSITWKISECEL